MMKQLTELSMLQLQFLNAGIQGNKQWGKLLWKLQTRTQDEAIAALAVSKEKAPVKTIQAQIARQLTARRAKLRQTIR